MELTELKRDAIAELLNIGMGVAAASLSELVDEEVGLSVPSVEIVTQDLAAEQIRLAAGNDVAGIREAFAGPFWGDALLLFPETKSLELVRVLLKDENLSLNTLLEMEQEALVEVGNIILNACISTLANVFNQELTCQLPQYIQGTCDAVMSGDKERQYGEGVLLLRMDFVLRNTNISGYFLLLMGVESMRAFTSQIEAYQKRMI